MIHEPDVRLIDAPTEGVRRDNYFGADGHEALLDFIALFARQAAMVEDRVGPFGPSCSGARKIN